MNDKQENILVLLDYSNGRCWYHRLKQSEKEEIASNDDYLNDIEAYVREVLAERYCFDVDNCHWMMTNEDSFGMYRL